MLEKKKKKKGGTTSTTTTTTTATATTRTNNAPQFFFRTLHSHSGYVGACLQKHQRKLFFLIDDAIVSNNVNARDNHIQYHDANECEPEWKSINKIEYKYNEREIGN